VKANKTIKGQAIQYYRKRKSKKVASNIGSVPHNKPLNSKENYITGITTYLSILALNINRLNSPIKRH
jgi:hypothetical protein